MPSKSFPSTKTLLLYALSFCCGVLVPTQYSYNRELYTPFVLDLPLVSYFNSTVNESFAPAEVILPSLPPFKSSTLTEPTAWTLTVSKGTKKRKSIVCYCAKCGSTSITNELYKIVFGKPWDYPLTEPWIQELDSTRWEGLGKKVRKIDFGKTSSFAVIRDPKERIMSAFRSKVGCQGWNDLTDREKIVPTLLRLAGLPKKVASKPQYGSGLCLNKTVYLRALFMIHEQGLQGELNDHFLPQHLHCFRHAPPSKWTVVTTVESPKARCDLESVVSGKSAGVNCSLVKTHSSGKKARTPEALSTIDEARLNAITRKEYKIFGSYLD